MEKWKGHLLPAGDAYTEDMACAIVFYPDMPEYRRALLGSLAEFAIWQSWEKESEHKGIDAALAWKEALDLTVDCLNMACLEQLQSDIHDILLLLQNDICCSDNVTYGDQTTYITNIWPNTGSGPDYYGETAVDDWEEWSQYLCYNANLWIDELIKQANSFETVLSVSSMTIALFAYAIEAIAFFVVGGQVHGPDAISRTLAIIAGYVADLWGDAADDIETDRDDILCAIMQGTSLEDAIEDVLASGTAWDLFYQFIDYDSAVAILYNGGDGDAEYLEAEKELACGCTCLPAYLYYSPTATLVYADDDGCQISIDYDDLFGYTDVIYAQVHFNAIPSATFCGSMKVIDTISVADGLSFARIKTFDQDFVTIDDYYVADQVTCSEAIGQLVDDTIAGFNIGRYKAADGGCGGEPVVITITYHNAA